VTLPAPELLLGNPQHAAHILPRVFLLGRNIEHAKILACAPEQEKEIDVTRIAAALFVHRGFIPGASQCNERHK
jgi:hypothetical protein